MICLMTMNALFVYFCIQGLSERYQLMFNSRDDKQQKSPFLKKLGADTSGDAILYSDIVWDTLNRCHFLL